MTSLNFGQRVPKKVAKCNLGDFDIGGQTLHCFYCMFGARNNGNDVKLSIQPLYSVDIVKCAHI